MPSVPTVSWSESDPQGSENIALGDNRLREMKTQLREVIAVDHEMASSGQTTTTGQHKQVTLQEQANLGTGAVGATILGNQTVSGKGELVYTDEDNNDVQITSGGFIRAASLSTVPIAQGGTGVTTLAALLNLVYPVGSVYVNVSDSTNPGTLLGFGTWSALGAGRMIVGFDAGDTSFDTAGETGGANTVTIAQANLPAVELGLKVNGGTVGARSAGGDGPNFGTSANGGSSYTATATLGGSGTALSVLNKYVTCYTWKRTA